MPIFQFDMLMHNDHALLTWLQALVKTGLCMVENCPLEEDAALTQLSSRAGFMRATSYDEGGGSIFNVVNKFDNANNQAYTDGPLPLHTDLPFMRSPPDFQLLVCLKQAASGGHS